MSCWPAKIATRFVPKLSACEALHSLTEITYNVCDCPAAVKLPFAESKIDFNNLRYGAGVGVRYLSPVGPLRVDVGFPLDRRWYEDAFVYFISLGYAF